MKNNKLYKYINLLLRIIIGVVAVWFIYIKLTDEFLLDFQSINSMNINYALISGVILLMILNWGVESYKWKYTIRNIQELSIFKAFKLTITGVTMGLITPNRIGEIPARALLLEKDNFKEIVLKTSVASFSQMVVTLLIGVVGLCFNLHYFGVIISSNLLFVLMLSMPVVILLLYFRINKLDFIFHKIKYLKEKEIFSVLADFSSKELLTILLLSLLRYVVFTLQYYLVLKAFDVPLFTLEDIFLIPVCFMIASFIPTILISELGVRGSVALFVFGFVSDADIQILLASIILWLINVAFPALLGIINLKELKILKEQ